MRSRAWAAVVGALVLAVLITPLALADGDPASDILLASNVFYPYSPGVSKSLQKTLNAETAAAARGHFHIKVALIGGPTDLGLIPQLFGMPQAYARFLGRELAYFLGPHALLLVVMPNGYGVENLPGADKAVMASLAKPSGKPNNDLAQAAIVAVRRLASAAGHPIGNVSPGSGNGSGGTIPVTIVVVALATLVVAAGILLTRRRLSARKPKPPGRPRPHRRSRKTPR